MECPQCTELVLDNRRLKCSTCEREFHVKCVTADKIDLRRAPWLNWTCDKCVDELSVFQRSSVLVRSPELSESTGKDMQENISLSQVWNLLLEIKEKVDSNEVKLEALLNVEKRVTAMETHIREVTSKVASLELKLVNEEQKNCELSQKVRMLDYYSRCRNVIIRNVPAMANSNLVDSVQKIAHTLGCPNVRIQEAHRTNHKKLDSNLVVVFASHSERNTFFHSAIKATLLVKDLFPDCNLDKKILVFEHLSPEIMNLLQKTRTNQKTLNLYKVVTRNGQVYYKRNESMGFELLRDAEELDEMLRQVDSAE